MKKGTINQTVIILTNHNVEASDQIRVSFIQNSKDYMNIVYLIFHVKTLKDLLFVLNQVTQYFSCCVFSYRQLI